MNTSNPYAAFVGIDRSDAKVDTTAFDSSGKHPAYKEVPSKPEALKEWVRSIRKQFPSGRIALCIERPCANLAAFFIQYEFFELFLINPASLKRWRETFQPSQAKDDRMDSFHLADFAFLNHSRLTPWTPDDPQTRQLRTLVESRRSLVDYRTQINNQLKALLKDYFPQALDLTGKYLYARLACAFLTKWPTLQALSRSKPDSIRKFYYAHCSRRPSVIDKRLELIEAAVPLTNDQAILEPAQLLMSALVSQLNALRGKIEQFDMKIETIINEHDDGFIFQSLPGAGANLASRILVAFGTKRERFPSAASATNFSGIAPVTEQSGKSRWVHRRFACPAFHRQTFIEWAGQTVTRSGWARAYYKQQVAKGARRYTALRALAYKWMRIIWRCWTDRVAYDEATYLKALQRSGSPLIDLMKSAAKEGESSVNKSAEITC